MLHGQVVVVVVERKLDAIVVFESNRKKNAFR